MDALSREPSPVPPPLLDWGVATRALPGQLASGDRYLVKPLMQGTLVAVVDALGHGLEAANAARIAIETLEAAEDEDLVALLQQCDRALRPTRGVVMSVAFFEPRIRTMTWLGVGNVEGVLLRLNGEAGPSRDFLMIRGGVVGYRLPPLRKVSLAIKPGDTLVFATDGIEQDFAEHLAGGAELQAMADRILSAYGKVTDDALVLIARYRGAVQ